MLKKIHNNGTKSPYTALGLLTYLENYLSFFQTLVRLENQWTNMLTLYFRLQPALSLHNYTVYIAQNRNVNVNLQSTRKQIKKLLSSFRNQRNFFGKCILCQNLPSARATISHEKCIFHFFHHELLTILFMTKASKVCRNELSHNVLTKRCQLCV